LKKASIFHTILISILLCVTNIHALEVRITEDKLSLHADQVPLQTILQRLGDLGINVRIDPQLNPNISASFDDRDIREALDSILKSLSHVLIWESMEGPHGATTKLAEIQVFKPGKEELMRPLDGRSGLSIARNPKDGSLFVKNEILLKLMPGMSSLEFKRLLRQIGGTVVDRNVALGIYKIRLPENANVPSLVEQITNHPKIAKAEPNYAYPLPMPYTKSAPAPSTHGFSSPPAPGTAAPVAILDTGLTPDSALENLVLTSLDIFYPNEPISDSLGHGTQMALIAAGVVRPGGVGAAYSETYSPIIPIRVFDDNGFTSNYHIMHSIGFALNHRARVMSLSWGSEIRSDLLESALNYARSKDLIIVASAGNEPTGKPVYPAAYTSVIGVGALGPDGKTWKRSNHGDFVTLYAPGFAILPVGYRGDPGAYAGTSISAALVANIIANYLSHNPKATMQDVLIALNGRF
jgi:hypothetical protein